MKKIKYILEYAIVYSLYSLLKRLSIDTASNIGSFIARAISPFTSKTRIARINLKFVFPHYSESEINQVIKKMWDNIGRTMAELCHIHTISDEDFSSRVTIITNQNIKNITQDKATICISGHFGNWEAVPRTMLAYHDKISIIYRETNNSLVNDIYLSLKDKRFHNIPKGNKGVKIIFEAIKNQHFIGFLSDQKLNQGIKVDFFGKPAMTPSAPIKLAIKFNLPVLFVRSIRTHGANFKVHIDGPYEIKDLLKDCKNIEDKELALTQKMNEIIEDWIKEDPSQWFWIHRRWEKDFYQ